MTLTLHAPLSQFSLSHAARYSERSSDSGQYADGYLQNCFPSVRFHLSQCLMFSVRVCNSPERPVPAVFGVFIDDRRLPSFMTRVGLNRRPEQGTKGCSFDCRCKDTTFSGRMQAFTLTFYAENDVSS